MSSDHAEAGTDSLDWLASPRAGFGRLDPNAEQRFTGTPDPHHSVNETWWFEASVPERGLTVNFYISMRPNLKMCSAGSWMWTGHKATQSLADHLNFQLYLPEPRFTSNNDGPNRIEVPEVGLTFTFVEPFKQILIRYKPPGFNVEAELTVRALFAPVVRANEKHFEQATWTSGHVTIDGERYAIDGPSFRDRSWGEPRREEPLAHPPIGWLYGVLDGGRAAFNLSGCDDPAHDAVWAQAYPQIDKPLLFDGWLMRDGELKKIVSMSKRTEREPQHLEPRRIDIDFVDVDGGEHRLTGEVASSFNLHFWPNLNTWVGLTHWTLDGLTGHGGCQDYAWPDYAKKFWAK